MGAPPLLPTLQPFSRQFPQWSRTAIVTVTGCTEDDVVEVKKSTPDSGSGFIIGSDAAARVAHLEHSVRFLQEQHRLMLSGLHAEIEALRERNRDLQFQLIFNKESSSKASSPAADESENSEVVQLKRDVARLETEAGAARGEARAAEARALQLQRLVDAQAEKLRELEVSAEGAATNPEAGAEAEAESRAELRARLGSAERLVRRLRGDAERQRREVLAASGGVTNLLFDDAARRAHLQCMKSSLQASLRGGVGGVAGVGGVGGVGSLDTFAYQTNFHFPPLHTPEFWREPLREEYSMGGSRGRPARRPLTLPELAAVGQPLHRSPAYAHNHTRGRTYGYDKNKKAQPPNGETVNGKSPEEQPELSHINNHSDNISSTQKPKQTYPELKIVVTKIIPHGYVNAGEARPRARRPHRKHAPDHT